MKKGISTTLVLICLATTFLHKNELFHLCADTVNKNMALHLQRFDLLLLNPYKNPPLDFIYKSLKGLEKYESLDAHPIVGKLRN